jgi:N-acetylglucosaminyldiphosphoundecaprenol N-acetyl-beta-D-mannosaminyltransferase
LRKVCRVISINTNVLNLDEALEEIEELASLKKGAYVCVSNVHMCMEAFDSVGFQGVVNKADLVVPDGRPIYWAQRLLGAFNASQIRGQELMNQLCAKSGSTGLKIGLYGGASNDILNEVIDFLSEKFPNISIVFSYSPPFRDLNALEDVSLVSEINKSNVDILFVGIGCPRQERWMAEHRVSLNCVMIGVGAAFDFISGRKKTAPRWMQIIGMEWFFRFICEPKRLWRRYLIGNPRFLYHFFKQFAFRS